MSLAQVAAIAPSLGDLLNPGLSARVDHGSAPILNARNSTGTRNTVNLFIDAANSAFQYGASIVTAYVDQTVYALQCTSGPATVNAATCGPNGAIFTVAEGPSLYIVSSAAVTTTTQGTAVTATVQETCILAGTTAATCTATVQATAAGTLISTTFAETLSGTNYKRFDVEITAGAEKTVSPTGPAPTGKNAAPSLNPKTMAIWALTGVIGASILTIF